MICEEIIQILEKQSPREYACDWDNVGLQVGSRKKKVGRIYIALDATDETVQEAVDVGADLLLTHHPMIFRGLKKVDQEDFIGRRIIKLIKNDMAYYAMHTNFDIIGMADLAAGRLGLAECSVLQPTGTDIQKGETPVGIGKVGRLPVSMSLAQCIEHVKDVFEVETVKVFSPSAKAPERMDPSRQKLSQKSGEPWHEPSLEKSISRLAVCPGSGKSVIEDAIKAGAEVLVTGDIDHHEGIDAAARGMAVIDAGHYGVEKIFIPYMKAYLEAELAHHVEVFAQKPKQPFFYI